MSRTVDAELIAKAPSSTEALLDLLFHGLDWPLPPDRDVEDVPLIDLRSSDLHLREDAIARLSSVKQIPRLTAQQPFGVFILTFEGERLPIGAVRRVVDGVVRRKRSRGSGRAAVWDLDDLIFFCRTGDGGGSIHVVAFREQDGKRALRAISWSTDLPVQKLELLSGSLLPALIWPGDGGVDLDGWRNGWRGAFQTAYQQGVRSARALAQAMAETARDVRDGVQELIELETDDGPLRRIFTQVKTNLREDLDEATFADMYAQTMVYGLLTARITHPEDFSGATTTLKFENPFLDALYETFGGDETDAVDVDEFGLLDLADLLAQTDVDAILAEFGTDDRRKDPVIYFYEEFLERYDPAKRKELGSYYTPVPVVTWIVDAVDHLLRTRLHLLDGVHDSTSWADYEVRTGLKRPVGAEPDEPVIRALDPATGTGTFLLEWLRHAAGDAIGAERARILASALERIDAFEIDLPGYTVAHLKASLELPPELRSSVTPSIVLTDTLAGRRELVLRADDIIAAEGARAEHLKFVQNHNIIIGNPPYRRLAQSAGGGMITAVNSGRRLIDDFYETALANAGPRYLQQFYNLYIYFWRWSIWKAFEQNPDGPAVIGLITPSSWMTGRGFMGVREHLRRHADDVFIVDLGGANRGAAKDPNIFGIQSPVAITIAVRYGTSDHDRPAAVNYTRITGTKDQKLAELARRKFATTEWQVIDAGWLDPLMPSVGDDEWLDYPALADLLPWQQSGAIYSRTWPIAPHPSILKERWERFMSTDDPEDRAACFKTAKHGRKITTRVRDLTRLVDEPIGAKHQDIVPYAYRSFDRQWTFKDPRLAFTESPTLWDSLSGQQIFMAVSMNHRMTAGPAATCTISVPDYDFFRGRGGKDVLPLYRDARGTPNVDPNVLARIRELLSRSAGVRTMISAEHLFTYVYGILSGSDFAERFHAELEISGPRIPLTTDPELFLAMSRHGRRLIWVDTLGERFDGDHSGEALRDDRVTWGPEPTKGPTSNRDVRHLPATEELLVGDGVLHGVSEQVASFEISGMNVITKWIGYRTLKGAGKSVGSANPLDAIRHRGWFQDWSEELRRLVIVLGEHRRMQKRGIELLDSILAGPMATADDLPGVDERWRVPDPSHDLGGLFDVAAED